MSTWVLLRGLTRESRHWGDFPRLLEAATGACNVIALDLPGNGRLHASPSPSSVEAMAAWCRAALRERGSTPPYHLLAMSLGAMVALAWAARHPHDLRGCVLLNTSLRGISPWHRRLRPRSYLRLLRVVVAHSPRAAEALILALTTNHPGASRESLLSDWTTWRGSDTVSIGNAVRQLWAAARFSAPARRPEVPLLLLAGVGDGLVDPSCSRRLAQVWNIDLQVHPSAGHDLSLDDGAWVAQRIAEWLPPR